jgi:hypothetical protein
MGGEIVSQEDFDCVPGQCPHVAEEDLSFRNLNVRYGTCMGVK